MPQHKMPGTAWLATIVHDVAGQAQRYSTFVMCSCKMCTSGLLVVQSQRQTRPMMRQVLRTFPWKGWTMGWLCKAATAVTTGGLLQACVAWLVGLGDRLPVQLCLIKPVIKLSGLYCKA